MEGRVRFGIVFCAFVLALVLNARSLPAGTAAANTGGQQVAGGGGTGDDVAGIELQVSVVVPETGVRAEGTAFIPAGVRHVRAVFVTVPRGHGKDFYGDPQVRRLAAETGSALLMGQPGGGPPPARASGVLALLRQIAVDSVHPEVTGAPILLWGHSAGTGLGTDFPTVHPERTIALVRYHGQERGELETLRHIPILFFAGRNDTTNRNEPQGTLFRKGRLAAAPWTFAWEPEVTHHDPVGLKKANTLLIPWISAVLRLRLPQADPAGPLRPITNSSGWLGDDQSGHFAPFRAFGSSRDLASWLPDEASARAWRLVIGAK